MRRGKMNKSNRGGGGGGEAAEAEVEELLKAAEDEILLQLSVNSHRTTTTMTRSDNLDLDLIRRFEALKSPPSSKPIPHPTTTINNEVQLPLPTTSSHQQQIGEDKKTLNDREDDLEIFLRSDLSTRFAALKNNHRSSTTTFTSITEIQSQPNISHDHEGGTSGGGGSEDEEEDDEVNKLIKWAMDAARLDPSPPTDDDDDIDQEHHDEDEDSS